MLKNGVGWINGLGFSVINAVNQSFQYILHPLSEVDQQTDILKPRPFDRVMVTTPYGIAKRALFIFSVTQSKTTEIMKIRQFV